MCFLQIFEEIGWWAFPVDFGHLCAGFRFIVPATFVSLLVLLSFSTFLFLPFSRRVETYKIGFNALTMILLEQLLL